MDKNIYKFIFYLIFFTSFESKGQLMFIDNFENGQSGNREKSAHGEQICIYDVSIDFKHRDLHLAINNLVDNEGISMSDKDLDFTFFPAAQFGDIVFNELMADPTPVVKLPNAEFIEVKNSSAFPINMKNWILEVNGKQKILSDKTVESGNYLIISGTGGNSIFGSYGANLEVSGLTLANDGVNLKLYSAANVLIDSFIYKPAMHHKGFSAGGYSLERIDPMRICNADSNWETSKSEQGGTPGMGNSVFRNNQDNTAPTVNSVIVASPALLEIIVSETPDLLSISGRIFSYSPSLTIPDSIRFDRINQKYSIYFPKGTIKSGVAYKLTINELTDECGNKSPVEHREFWYYLPKPGDILINEVLFNPFPGGVDFVEIYNHSGRKIELAELFLGSRDNNYKIKLLYPLSVKSEILLDTQYAAVTSDSAALLTSYYSACPDCIYEMEKFPAFNLDEGWVVLLNKEMEIIEEFHYLESMQHPMISDVKGISLERNSFSKSSNDPLNWHSASKTVGFATPGYRNSTTEAAAETSEMVIIEPKIFSPNDDGVNDRLLIKLSPGEPGVMVNIRIFNENGLEIKRLANNLMIGAQDILEWDGIKENHQKASLGIYIIKVEFFGLQSRRKQFKTVCVLTDRLE